MPARPLVRDAFVNNSGSQKRGTQKNGAQKAAETAKSDLRRSQFSASFCALFICVPFICDLLLFLLRPDRGAKPSAGTSAIPRLRSPCGSLRSE
jgi:hypothetical protein